MYIYIYIWTQGMSKYVWEADNRFKSTYRHMLMSAPHCRFLALEDEKMNHKNKAC